MLAAAGMGLKTPQTGQESPKKSFPMPTKGRFLGA